MNWKNKKLVLTVRIIFGLMLIFSGISGLYAGFNGLEGVPEEMIPMTEAFWQSGVFQLAKITETVAGLMLIFGFFPALGTLALVPLSVGIIVINAMTSPEYLVTSFIFAAFTAYFVYVYWDKFRVFLKK